MRGHINGAEQVYTPLLETKVGRGWHSRSSVNTVVRHSSIRLFCSCVHWNKRRMSSKWYKCVAIIKYQRPRKGFSLKYNADTKRTRTLYKWLDKLQIDGSHILLNHDDQAGFCLDSTFPHKNMPSLNVHSSNLTTHTEFLNKHQTQLQTTSYNFT